MYNLNLNYFYYFIYIRINQDNPFNFKTGLATELPLGIPGRGVSDSGGTEHLLGDK